MVRPISAFRCEIADASVGDSILTTLVLTPTLAAAPMRAV